MIDRRALLAGGMAGLILPDWAAAAPAGVPASGRLGFDVLRAGKKLGTHTLSFRRNGEILMVEVNVELAYKVGPVTLFHYSHHASERWAGGEVVALDTQTNENGTRYRVSGRREAGAFMVEGTSAPRYAAPSNALPATHWNRRELDGPWINTQDGKLLRPQVAARGTEAVPTANGTTRARHYALSGAIKLDMWYEDDGQWASLAFVKNGAEVRYLRR